MYPSRTVGVDPRGGLRGVRSTAARSSTLASTVWDRDGDLVRPDPRQSPTGGGRDRKALGAVAVRELRACFFSRRRARDHLRTVIANPGPLAWRAASKQSDEFANGCGRDARGGSRVIQSGRVGGCARRGANRGRLAGGPSSRRVSGGVRRDGTCDARLCGWRTFVIPPCCRSLRGRTRRPSPLRAVAWPPHGSLGRSRSGRAG